MYTIYVHVFPNGKRYVGMTKRTVERRWNNGNGYKACPLVDRAIEKYGWENVKHEVLQTAKTQRDAEVAERYYIALYSTTDPKFGYNVLEGGNISNNHADDEMRYKLGNGNRGKVKSADEKQKISYGVKKVFERPESNGHFGMKMSDESRKKQSESRKKRWSNDELRRSAARERMSCRMSDPAIKSATINRLALCRRKKGEYKWSEEAKAKLSKAFKGRWVGGKSHWAKPVLQFTKDGVFLKRWDCAKDAERAGVALACNISKCCLHKKSVHIVGGYVWRFESDENC